MSLTKEQDFEIRRSPRAHNFVLSSVINATCHYKKNRTLEGAAGKDRIDSEWSQTDLKDSADVFPMICHLGCPQVAPQCT